MLPMKEPAKVLFNSSQISDEILALIKWFSDLSVLGEWPAFKYECPQDFPCRESCGSCVKVLFNPGGPCKAWGRTLTITKWFNDLSVVEERSAFKHEGNMNVRGVSQVGKAVFHWGEWWAGEGEKLWVVSDEMLFVEREDSTQSDAIVKWSY